MANKLKKETSPYLLQHADNPVNWLPWGEEAFERAREEDKPIFLSIGYAACHWCHVMAHESFEDPETAEVMNEHFVNVKVDREERPDVDSIYMDAVVALNGQGGWPLSVFLTPDGQPFYGGTYFPPQRRFNMPAFREVLESIHEEWSTNRGRVQDISDQLLERIQSKPAFEKGIEQLEESSLDYAAERLFERYDWKFGGWGSAPKFPAAPTIEFLLQRYHRQNDRLALDMAKHVLRSMARGGMFDQIGGGFHRYSVDERWLVPHFEKMLYDNAVLLPAYLHAWQITGDQDFRRVVEKTLAFLMREMRNEQGGFFASLDADSEGEEGKFYVWTESELRATLPIDTDFELAMEVYGVRSGPNFEGANILYLPTELDELAKNYDLSMKDLLSRLDEIESKLLSTRAERVRPATDDKVITAWNGLLLSAIAESARVLNNSKYLGAAQDLANFLIGNLRTETGWKRTWREGQAKHNATLRDLTAGALGFLTLYETDFNPSWFEAAEAMTAEILEHYSDPDGGFFDTHEDLSDLITRPKTVQDAPIPSGNSLAIQLLLKMYSLSGDDRYAAQAETALRGMQSVASQHPTAFAGWLIALDYAIGPRLQLALIGDPDEDGFNRFQAAIDQKYLPLLCRAGGPPQQKAKPHLLQGREMLEGMPTAYLCQGFVCNKPTNSIDELITQIEQAHT